MRRHCALTTALLCTCHPSLRSSYLAPVTVRPDSVQAAPKPGQPLHPGQARRPGEPVRPGRSCWRGRSGRLCPRSDRTLRLSGSGHGGLISRMFNQTTAGRISTSSESFFGTQLSGTGGYITGSGGAFTIWQTAIEDVVELTRRIEPTFEWPNQGKCVATVALLMSGRRADDGDLLGVQGLTAAVDLECPAAGSTLGSTDSTMGG